MALYLTDLADGIDGYISDVKRQRPFWYADVAFDGGLADGARAFIRGRHALPAVKLARIKRMLACLGLGDTVVKMPYRLKREAFMTDANTLSLSVRTVGAAGTLRTLKVVLHEAGHLLALKDERYAALLALDREFIGRYGGRATEVMPTEYVATAFGVTVLTGLSERIPEYENQLAEQAHAEAQKLVAAARLL